MKKHKMKMYGMRSYLCQLEEENSIVINNQNDELEFPLILLIVMKIF